MKRTIAAIMIICVLAFTLVGCSNTNNNAAAAPVVQGLVIDTYAQGENLHTITDETSIKKAYDIYCKYAEEKGCQKETPESTKQLLTLTFKLTDGGERTADFYQEGSGKYYMDMRNSNSTVEKTVSITEETFNTIKDLLNSRC